MTPVLIATPQAPKPEHTFYAGPLTFFQHAHFETLHEATGLAGFASALCDFTFVRGWAAVLYVTYSTECEGKRQSDRQDRRWRQTKEKVNFGTPTPKLM